MLIAAGRVWGVCLEWGEIQPVDQAAYPEGSDAVSVEIPLEVSPIMWDPCLVLWEIDADQKVEQVVAACQWLSGEGQRTCVGICDSVVSLVLSQIP